MQTVKEKLSDMKEMRKVKAEARAEEQAEREMARARVEIAHEVRLAREAEGTMELHVAKACQKADREIAKHTANLNQPPHSIARQNDGPGTNIDHPYGQDDQNNPVESSTAAAAATATSLKNTSAATTAATATGLKNTTDTAGAARSNNLLPPDFNIFTSKRSSQ